MKNILAIYFAFTQLIVAQDIEIHGAIKSAMKGDISAKFDLRELSDKNNIYGLGAVENLKGEIIIINSIPYISQVIDNKIRIDSTFKHKAALFTYTEIENWSTGTINHELDLLKLDHLLKKKNADKLGPVSFIIKGKVKSLKWHVIDWAKGDTIHTHQKHKTSGLHGEIENESVTIFGFYSKNYKGIITHRNSNLHLHFINKSKTLSGHVDDLILEKGILELPAHR